MNVRLNNITINCMLAALLSALFASCKDDNEDEAVVDRRNPNSNVISFSTYTAGATRAAEVDVAWLKSNSFCVSAFNPDNTFFFKDKAFNNRGTKDGKVDAQDGIFDTNDKTYYWPTSSDAYPISFYAFGNVNKSGWYQSKTPNEVAFEVLGTASQNSDLVVAYAKADKMPTGGVQPLNFIHALSKVNFSFVGAEPDDYIYTINRVDVISAFGNIKWNSTETKSALKFNKTTEVGSTSTPSEMIEWYHYDKIEEITEIKPLVKKNSVDDRGVSGVNQGFLCTYFDTKDDNASSKVIAAGSAKSTMNENCRLLPQDGKIAIRIYYKVEEKATGKLVGNCGFYKTDESGNHDVKLDANGKVDNNAGTNSYTSGGIKGCKTLIVDLGKDGIPVWEPNKAYRFIITLPTDNFLGDGANGNEPDGVADDLDEEGNDLDGDGDENDSEFGMDEGGYIEFSVKVFSWEDDKRNVNIEIQN